jgi:hypothetical protein
LVCKQRAIAGVLDQIFGRYPCATGSLRRYQHERLGIIATLTIAATPDAQIIRIIVTAGI